MNAEAGPGPMEGRLPGTALGGRIRILETWFDEDPESLEGYDVWIAHRRSRPVSEPGWLYFYTLRNDLRPDPERILAGMRKSTSKGIRQARERHGCVCAFEDAPGEADLEAFADRYDANPLTPEQPPISRDWLRAYLRTGMLRLSVVQAPDGEILVQHLLLAHRRSGIVEPFQQASVYKTLSDPERVKLTGDANRLLFYSEYLHFRELGYHTYDFNGWYAGQEDPKRLQINLFKEGFGGEVWHGYDCTEAVSLRGRLFLLAKRARQMLRAEGRREYRRRRQAAALPQAT